MDFLLQEWKEGKDREERERGKRENYVTPKQNLIPVFSFNKSKAFSIKQEK